MMAELKVEHTVLINMPMLVYAQEDFLFGDWRDDVVLWWNKFAKVMFIKRTTNEYVFKTKQLYLHGRSNSGKSTFVRYLLGML